MGLSESSPLHSIPSAESMSSIQATEEANRRAEAAYWYAFEKKRMVDNFLKRMKSGCVSCGTITWPVNEQDELFGIMGNKGYTVKEISEHGWFNEDLGHVKKYKICMNVNKKESK